MPSIIRSFAPGIRPRCPCRPRVHQRIDGAVNDQVGALTACQPFLAAAGGEDGAELAARAGRIGAALKDAFAARAIARFVLAESCLPAAPSRSSGSAPEIPPWWSAPAPSAMPVACAGRRRNAGVSGRRHDRGQRAYPLRKRDRDLLSDHAAHRGADQMRRLEAERIHQSDRVPAPCRADRRARRPGFSGTAASAVRSGSGACRRRVCWTCRCRGCRSG